RLAKSLIETSDVQSPWNLRLPRGPLGRYQPVLQVDPAPQLEHHVRRAAVPAPAGHDELLALVADLHATGLDMSRPLWECHLIDGLSNGRFAIYLKIHHALPDGTSAMRLVMDMLSESPDARRSPPVWAIPPASRNVGSGAAPIWRLAEGAARRALEPGNLTRGRDAAKAAAKLARAIVHTASAAVDPTDPLAAPFTG